MEKKAFEPPKLGVFYMVPDPKSGKYTIYSEHGDEALHLMLWDSIIELLRRRFRGKPVDAIGDKYLGLPRGRIMENGANQWKIAWGNDFPEEYKSDVISEFSMSDAKSLGKVTWEFQSHETMQPGDKKAVEKVLDITITPEGFKQKVNSEKIIKEVVKKK